MGGRGRGKMWNQTPTDIKGWMYFFLDYSIFKEMAEGNIVYIASHSVFFFHLSLYHKLFPRNTII